MLVVAATSALAIAFFLYEDAYRPQMSAIGIARVIDGDTLEISRQRVRLANFHAPERGDSAGARATEELHDLASGKVVECHGRELDIWRRLIARCSVNGADLGDSMRQRGTVEQRRDGRPVWRW